MTDGFDFTENEDEVLQEQREAARAAADWQNMTEKTLAGELNGLNTRVSACALQIQKMLPDNDYKKAKEKLDALKDAQAQAKQQLENGDLTVDADLTITPETAADAATPQVPANTGAYNDGKLESVSGVKLANTTTLNAGTPTSNLAKKNDTTGEWETENVDWADATHILVVYPGADSASTDDNIIIALELGDKDNWTYAKDLTGDGAAVDGYFYYNKVLESGDNTEKLILSATLDDSVKSGAYLTMTYDLTVGLDSIQVTPDEAKSDASYVTGVNSNWDTVTASKSGETVTWTKKS